MNQENGIIYIATNLVNGKQNVGQTIRKLKKRMGEHKGTDNGQLLHKAIKKFGKKQSQKSINKRIKSYKRTIKLKRRMKNV